jgi:hypothetical protein
VPPSCNSWMYGSKKTFVIVWPEQSCPEAVVLSKCDESRLPLLDVALVRPPCPSARRADDAIGEEGRGAAAGDVRLGEVPERTLQAIAPGSVCGAGGA